MSVLVSSFEWAKTVHLLIGSRKADDEWLKHRIASGSTNSGSDTTVCVARSVLQNLNQLRAN